jgi:hypothetical protein
MKERKASGIFDDIFTIQVAYAADEHPEDVYLNPPEDSESGSNNPYSGLPARITRVEANESADGSKAPENANANDADEGASSSKQKGKGKSKIVSKS